ncbi:MAG TPA: 16S rRNA (cytosine(1402)-N(4))-methyltransferase RsmH, partial [Candidatus Peribacteria bacterium]|nr:16S rRNA (cytosine(1402)-N(4))-methyltransferase RsmH [Candidatus Peribacteria bacterium]
DVTAGLGGHSIEFSKRIGAKGTLTIVDADATNLEEATKRIGRTKGFSAVHANFRQLPECLPEDAREFDAIFADLGLSSPHLDQPERGFTFRAEAAPLDMRYDKSRGRTAADLLQDLPANKLADLLQDFGEVPHAMGLATAIVKQRDADPILLTGQLVAIVNERFGYKAPGVLPQVFQALRIAVNGELDALEHLLEVAPQLLAPGGRFAVLSYHSLEDRMVKRRFRDLATPVKDALTGAVAQPAAFDLLARGGIVPTQEEIRENPRSRSARLRAIVRAPLYTSA